MIDGLTLGIAWSDSVDLGVATLIAVVCCELPQELGDFGILVSAGFTKWQAILWNLCSACFAILGCIIGLAVGTSVDTATPWLLALAAGNFLYISLVNMMPQVRFPPSFYSFSLFFLNVPSFFFSFFLSFPSF